METVYRKKRQCCVKMQHCRFFHNLRQHAAQGASGHAEQQCSQEAGGRSGEAPGRGGQGDQSQQGEIQEAACRAPEILAGFHHFTQEKAGQKAGQKVNGSDPKIYDRLGQMQLIEQQSQQQKQQSGDNIGGQQSLQQPQGRALVMLHFIHTNTSLRAASAGAAFWFSI